MFGIHYTMKCPFCGQDFYANHGVTSYYRIKGQGDTKYIVEWCSKCDTKFFSAQLGWVQSRKDAGIPLEDVINEGIQEFTKVRHSRREIAEEKERITEKYGMDLPTIKAIKCSDVNKEDVLWSHNVCW